MRNIEITQGLRAGLALIAARPDDVVRVAYSRASARLVEPATRSLRARGIPCRPMADEELDRLAKAVQHEGLIVEARPRAWTSLEALAAEVRDRRGVAVALDHVRNPYNVGAVLRSAAFFGARGFIIGTSAQHPALDAQAVRVAEGGAEHVALVRTSRLAEALAHFKKQGVRVVGADGRAEREARELSRPVVLVFGHEREGIHPRVRAECDELVAIRGAGTLESLNVAVAAGILLERASR